MNKKTFSAVALTLLLGACNKGGDSVSTPKDLIPLSFSVSALTTDVVPFSRAATNDGNTLSSYFTTLEYFGYSNRAQVFKGTQLYDDTPETFGIVGAAAPTGTYYIGFFGIGAGVGNYKISKGTSEGDNDYIESTGREIWYKEFKNIEISNTMNSIAVEMTRKTGRITLNITDDVPTNVKKVSIEIHHFSRYDITYGHANTTTWVTYSTDIPITDTKLGSFEFNCFPSSGAAVNLSIYDKDNALLDQRSLNVEVFENRKTIITGKLFNNVGSKEFTVTVSDNWGDDNIVDI